MFVGYVLFTAFQCRASSFGYYIRHRNIANIGIVKYLPNINTPNAAWMNVFRADN